MDNQTHPTERQARPPLMTRHSSRGCVHDTPFSATNPDRTSPSPISRDPIDVAVIGGGACGLAVIIHLVERIRNGNAPQLRSIILIEKQNVIGPGLPYSQACKSTRLNMHTNTMGLYANDPFHFRDWISGTDLEYDAFHSREIYGDYLKDLFTTAVKDCQNLGVAFGGLNNEVVDIQKVGEYHEIALANDGKLKAKEVVLALGNFCMSIHQHLSPNDKYFRCPWPAEKLKRIPKKSSVFVIGSRLSAVDVAIVLMEHGHQGSITFVSRSGKLPKVQAAAETFSRKYMLYSLAREVESCKNIDGEAGAFAKVLSKFQEEIGSEAITSFLMSQFNNGSPLETLRKDVIEAESGGLHWQTVIRATPNLAERYWNACTAAEKEIFLNIYNSLWVTYRHAMPLENARKILRLLETGQLRVVRGEPAEWNGHDFVIHSELDSKTKDIHAEYVIEALGQEYDTINIESPLLKKLLASKSLVSHPSGGVEVDFATSKASSSGIYVIGSLTRGVHFYTSAIDRIAAHASRIADSIIGVPVRRSLHIAFFVGSDLFSHLMLSKLIPKLLLEGHIPFIFQPLDKVNNNHINNKNNSSKAKLQPFVLRELAFFERELLQDHIIPFIGASKSKIPNAKFTTVPQIAAQHGLLYCKIPSINSLEFLNVLKEHHIDLGFSLRCYQKFGNRIIKFFEEGKKALLNLHPGILPEYRGVVTKVRAMLNGEREFGYSLHHVDREFDRGDVIDVRRNEIDYGKGMLEGMLDHYEMGIEMVLSATTKFALGSTLHEEKIKQDPQKANYYTFLTQQEIDTCEKKGIRLLDAGAVEDILVDCFGGDKDGFYAKGLREFIDERVEWWYMERRTEKLMAESEGYEDGEVYGDRNPL